MRHDLITPAHDRRQMVRREILDPLDPLDPWWTRPSAALPEVDGWARENRAFRIFVAKVGIAVAVILLPPSIYSYCTRPSVQSSAIVNTPVPGAEAGAGMGFSK